MNVKLGTKWFLLLTVSSLCLSIFGVSIADAIHQRSPQPASASAGKSFTDFQKQLLETAFETASKIPVEPHIVTRSVSQEEVINVFLQMNQPDLAVQYVDRIENWRRGTGHAAIGLYFGRHGQPEKARKHLEFAEKIAAEINDWQRDRIRAFVARGYTYLGQNDKAADLTQNIDKREAARVTPEAAIKTDEQSYESQVEGLKTLMNRQFEIKTQALIGVVELWNTFYANKERRNSLGKMLRDSWTDMNGSIRIDLLCRMAEYALRHQDTNQARVLLKEARGMLDIKSWLPEYGIPVMARMAGLFARAGETKIADKMIKQAEEIYAKNRLDIVNIYRAETLAPLAAAYQDLGRTEKAIEVYFKAIEESMENPNSRPRAEDLALICRSMAIAALKPTPEIWARIQQIEDGLGEPW